MNTYYSNKLKWNCIYKVQHHEAATRTNEKLSLKCKKATKEKLRQKPERKKCKEISAVQGKNKKKSKNKY